MRRCVLLRERFFATCRRSSGRWRIGICQQSFTNFGSASLITPTEAVCLRMVSRAVRWRIGTQDNRTMVPQRVLVFGGEVDPSLGKILAVRIHSTQFVRRLCDSRKHRKMSDVRLQSTSFRPRKRAPLKRKRTHLSLVFEEQNWILKFLQLLVLLQYQVSKWCIRWSFIISNNSGCVRVQYFRGCDDISLSFESKDFKLTNRLDTVLCYVVIAISIHWLMS